MIFGDLMIKLMIHSNRRNVQFSFPVQDHFIILWKLVICFMILKFHVLV
jgi:hypothetical protein